MRYDHGAIPRLKASLPHTQTVHDSTRVGVLRMPDSEQFFDGKPVEGKSRHAASRLTGETPAPEVWMEAPTNLDRVAFQTLKVRRRNGVSAKVLNAPCAGNAFGLGLDERPPTRSPSCPAPLDSCDHRCGLLSGLGLATNVPHHLREAIHRVQAVEMPLVEGLQAKPLGMEGGRAHWWFRVRPNVLYQSKPGLCYLADMTGSVAMAARGRG